MFYFIWDINKAMIDKHSRSSPVRYVVKWWVKNACVGELAQHNEFLKHAQMKQSTHLCMCLR